MDEIDKINEIQSENELLELAIQNELESRQFYFACAERVTSISAKTLFITLAEEEDKHAKSLELELMKQGKVVNSNPGQEQFNFTKYLEDINFDKDIDLVEIFTLAIHKEHARFRIYVEMSAITKSPELKEMLLCLAEEELRHKIMLEKSLKRNLPE